MTSKGGEEALKNREINQVIKQKCKKERERKEKEINDGDSNTDSEWGSEKIEIGAIIQLAAGAKGILSCHRSQPCRRESRLFYCTLVSVCVCAAPSHCIVATHFLWSRSLTLPSSSTYLLNSFLTFFIHPSHICQLVRICTLCGKTSISSTSFIFFLPTHSPSLPHIP